MAEKRRQLKSILGPATDFDGNLMSDNPEVLRRADEEDVQEFEVPEKEEKPKLGDAVLKGGAQDDKLDAPKTPENPMAAPGLNKPKPGKSAEKETVLTAYDKINQAWGDSVKKAMKPYNSQLAEIKTKLNDQLEKAEDVQERNQWLELAEMFGQSLVKLGAAEKGLKTGVDMSGTKFSKTDWDKKTSNALDVIQKRMDALAGEKAGVEAEAGKEVGRLEKLRAEAIRLQEAKDKRAAAKATKPTDTTPAQKKLEEKVGTEVAEWLTTGKANFEDNKAAVQNTIDILSDEDTAIGGMWGMLDPNTRLAGAGVAKWLGFKDSSEAVAKGAEAELSIASVIQKSLRETLGGQFAEREGENVLKRSFAPGLPKETLKKNAERVMNRLEAAAAAKDALAKRVAAGEKISPEAVNKIVNEAYRKAAKENPLETAEGGEQSAEKETKPAPHGNRVEQDGITYRWDGSQYVEEK